MTMTFNYNLFNRISTFFFFLLGFYLILYGYCSQNFKLIVFAMCYTPLILYYSILNYFATVKIDDETIIVYSKNLMKPRQLSWSEIGIVVDDVPEFLRWCPYMHAYNLIPKREFGEPAKKWVILTAYFKNYKDLLKEVVLRVSPNTKIEESILKLTGLTQDDIGLKENKGSE